MIEKITINTGSARVGGTVPDTHNMGRWVYRTRTPVSSPPCWGAAASSRHLSLHASALLPISFSSSAHFFPCVLTCRDGGENTAATATARKTKKKHSKGVSDRNDRSRPQETKTNSTARRHQTEQQEPSTSTTKIFRQRDNKKSNGIRIKYSADDNRACTLLQSSNLSSYGSATFAQGCDGSQTIYARNSQFPISREGYNTSRAAQS